MLDAKVDSRVARRWRRGRRVQFMRPPPHAQATPSSATWGSRRRSATATSKSRGQLSLVDEDDESAANDDTATSMTRGVGTFLYRAPEVAQHRAYDSGADMYSLGVVAFELLRGAPYGDGDGARRAHPSAAQSGRASAQ